jgi:uncharacterized caspase-like protein
VLAFGVSRYRNSSLDLQFADKDARDLAHLLAEGGRRGLYDVVARVMVDDQVTTANMRAAKDFLRSANVDDTVVVFLAGHGTYTDDRAAEYMFVTHDTDVSRLRETAAPFELIEELFADLPARRRLLLLDTCESGDRDEARAPRPTTSHASRGVVARSTRALVRVRADAPPPRAFLRDRERFIYNDLSRRSGVVVFSSSHGSELSYESPDWQNGAFTAELKLALSTPAADTDRNGTVSIDELRAYVSGAVARRTDGLQHPTIDRDNAAARIGLPIVTP